MNTAIAFTQFVVIALAITCVLCIAAELLDRWDLAHYEREEQ